MTGAEPGLSSRAMAGVGFRPQHAAGLLDLHPREQSLPGWLEIHPENYLMAGAALLDALGRVAGRWPLSFHSVGLSLGSWGGIDQALLSRIRDLQHRFNPVLLSAHLAWNECDSVFFNDLLPLPLTYETLELVSRNVDMIQQSVGCRILVENPASCLWFRHSVIPEPEFLASLVHRTGCALLLDLNNVAVSCHNMGIDSRQWMRMFPLDAVAEIHVAGHHQRVLDDGRVLKIDDHGSRVPPGVWGLLRQVVAVRGPVPVLVEWDNNIPPLSVLLEEAALARDILLQEEDVRVCIP